jgi:tRNA pseudouridine38-40 synthase
MVEYIIEIKYDGSAYRGYGTQLHRDTVQDDLEQALAKIFKSKIKTVGSSRTDANVHCISQFVIFTVPFKIDEQRLKLAINISTKHALYVVDCQVNKPGFHPRFNCVSKTYKYVIRKTYDPFSVNYSYYNRQKLDTKVMKKATKYFIGEHDFTSFCNVKTHVTDKVRTINSLEIDETDDTITIVINGNGFLYNMVRIIVGTLIDIGTYKLEPESITAIIEAKDRAKAGMTIAPNGLFLLEVKYK